MPAPPTGRSAGRTSAGISGDNRPGRRRRGHRRQVAALLGFAFTWWRRHLAGSVQRQTLWSYVAGLKPVVRALLTEGVACGCARAAKVCRKLLATEAALWTFAAAEGVPPHNNAAERALRHGVIWRKTSFGTDGEQGSPFAERMLTVVATCRQRGHDVLAFLAACLRSRLGGPAAPSLMA